MDESLVKFHASISCENMYKQYRIAQSITYAFNDSHEQSSTKKAEMLTKVIFNARQNLNFSFAECKLPSDTAAVLMFEMSSRMFWSGNNFPEKCFRSIKFRKCYENVSDNAQCGRVGICNKGIIKIYQKCMSIEVTGGKIVEKF